MNTTFYDVITVHSSMYPDMQPEDYLKLAFQSEFGCGHLIANTDSAYQYLINELNTINSDTLEPMTQSVGGGFARLNLAPVKNSIPPSVIFKLFLTGSQPVGTYDGLRKKLDLIVRSARLGIIKCPCDQLDKYFSSYIKGDIPSHSALYKRKYRPSYRIIDEKYASIIPAIVLICDVMRKKNRAIIGIDGRAKTGKTYAADLIASILDAEIIHTDQYKSGSLISNDRIRDINVKAESSNADIVIVEGTYSMSPALADLYDVKILTDTDPVTQKERIVENSGYAKFENCLNSRIAIEEEYFIKNSLQTVSDIIIRT